MLLEMKHIQCRKLFEQEFHFKDESLIICIPEMVQNDNWSIVPVMESNIVSTTSVDIALL